MGGALFGEGLQGMMGEDGRAQEIASSQASTVLQFSGLTPLKGEKHFGFLGRSLQSQ